MTTATINIQADSLNAAAVEEALRCVRQFGFVRVTGVLPGFRYEDELVRFGEPIPQYHGQLVRDIKPDPDLRPEVYSALSMDELNPHTEWYEFPGIPPRYVVLWYLRAARGAGGETTLADGREFLKKFSDSELVQMRERRYEWYGVPVEATPDAEPVRHPILEECGDDLVMRYSSKYVQRVEDGLMPRYIDLGQDFFRSQHMAIPAEDGDILIWDNWRMIHARNSFSDPDRHLRRMLLSHRPAGS